MTRATVRHATVPALVVYAVLTMSAEAARAGGEPLVPFPGTSVPGASATGAPEAGGGKSTESAPPPALGATAADPAAGPTLPDAAAGEETVTPPDAGTEVPGVAVPAADAGRSDAEVPGGAMTEEKPAMPAGGSRILRALAEGPKAQALPDDGAAWSVPRMAAEGCPRALLRRLLAGAAGEADALSALGIEREILTLCRERQEIVAGLFETEARLSELREMGQGPEPEASAPTPGEAASALRAALGAEEKANEAVPRVGDTRTADTRAAESQGNAPVQTPHYAWFSIIGTSGALRAGISDGIGVWFVREGDPLPGGATVAAIAGRPPGVQVTGSGGSGKATLLPFRARPGGGP